MNKTRAGWGVGVRHWCSRALALGVAALVGARAQAQLKDVAPYAAVVTAETAPLRCGDGLFYRVADLTRGQVVQVDGESPQYWRVSYPAGTPAFVRAEQATADESAATVKLKVPSTLQAIHLAAGPGNSWKALLATPLPEGTSLKWIETVKESGTVTGYKVVAPAGSRGFVDSKLLRRATPEEAAKAGLAVAAAPAPAPAQPTPAPVEIKQETKPEIKPATEPGKTVTDLTEPQIPAAATPAAGGAESKPQPEALSQPKTTPVEVVEPGRPMRTGTLEQLEEAFQATRKQPALEQTEIDALIFEFNRSIDEASSDPARQFRKTQLERRRDALKLMKEARERRLSIERTKLEIDERGRQVRDRIAQLEAQRVYTIIGMLVPSTVYDGKRLPLMYRLQSVGQVSATTVGYLKPTDVVSLNDKLGKVVGVVGDAQIDRSLMLNVITPTRVDVLQAAELTSPGISPGSSSPATPEGMVVVEPSGGG